MSCSLRRAAATDAASSGRLVPTATTDKPMTVSLTPQNPAMLTAPQTTPREPASSAASPSTSHNDARARDSIGVSATRVAA